MASEFERLLAELDRKAYRRTVWIGVFLALTGFSFIFSIFTYIFNSKAASLIGVVASAVFGLTTIILMNFDERRSMTDLIKLRAYSR